MGNCAARLAPVGTGTWNRRTSCKRCSLEATWPEVRLNVSVVAAWTTVPEGNGVGDCMARLPTAVPPVGGSEGGLTKLVVVAGDGIKTMDVPFSTSTGADIAMTGMDWH